MTGKPSPDSLRTNNNSNIVEVTLVNHGMSVGDSITFSNCDTVGGIAIGNLNGSRTVGSIISAVSLIQTITQDISSAALKFDHDYLHEYTYAQAGDVMFIAHQTFIPQQIVRTGLTTFQVESFQFDQKSDNKQIYQPYYPFQGAGVTLDVNKTSGTGATLTTSAAYWDTTSPSKHIGTTDRDWPRRS